MEPSGVLKVSLNREEFYAGDQIVANLQFTSRLTQRVRILAVQLAGFCTVSRDLVDEAKLETLRKMPSYLFGSFGALGGGRTTHTAMPKYRTTRLLLKTLKPYITF
jgi:hypothetical protein